ncbi:MAG: hypothetical protein HUK08_04430 [Bacteroidaceae bacterium]|nr:hypothetical protein [Bacteroidaceae bacterium]
MNLYIRYFDHEAFTTSFEQAFDFLYSIDEVGMNPRIEQDIRDYMNSSVLFPKRYKVRARAYFIMIKTTAGSMEEFKRNKTVKESGNAQEDEHVSVSKQHNDEVMAQLNEEKYGWYEGSIFFKRVVVNPHNGKCVYFDTEFVARCKAVSPADCYERLVNHLRGRVDERSQFPSVKGQNFRYTYLGEKLS